MNETQTPNGYDPRWIEAINDTLADRGSDNRAVDLEDALWERFIGPLVDAFEDGDDVPENLIVEGGE